MSWEVTRQRPDQIETDQAGNTTTGVVVYFTTGEGRQSSVFVENTLYGNVEAVQAAVAAKADLVDRVGNLRSDDYQA